MTTLRGVIRTMEASARRAEREQIRRQRELEKLEKEATKLRELERAEYEVESYENHIAVLQSMHQDCGDICNWQKIKNINPPSEPIKNDRNEKVAKANLVNYKPTFFQKIFGKVEKIKKTLEDEVKNAKSKDEENYKNELKQYEEERKDWEENVNLAEKIIDGDLAGYKEAFEKINPLSEINELGTSIEISFPQKDIIVVDINVHSDEIIPKEIKSLLKSGKLSVKQMPLSKFNEIYQDHICSSVLRIARESFAILPIQKVFVTAYSNLLNTLTGYKEDSPILSALMPRATLEKLNFDNLDPSDSMTNFVHNMNFKKTQGFSGVEKLDYKEYM